MFPEHVLRIADAWWAQDFDCDPAELRRNVPRVQAHAGDVVRRDGIWILVLGSDPIVSMPASMLPILGERARLWSRSTFENSSILAEQLAAFVVAKVIGPTFIGYATADTFKSKIVAGTRPLTDADSNAIATLRIACGGEEWDHGGSELGPGPIFGAFDKTGRLAAFAGYEVWNGQIAHISIVSAPDRRTRGFGASAVSLAAEHALQAGLLPQYRTLKSNGPSMGMAKKLGFQEYGYSLYVKLRAA
jgi:hypothetical protein